MRLTCLVRAATITRMLRAFAKALAEAADTGGPGC